LTNLILIEESGEVMSDSFSKVPRGFTRYYVLFLLTEQNLTGKSIINEISKRSDNSWIPSPGLIYPLLGRLVRDGFLEEPDGGEYSITGRGRKELEKYDDVQLKIDSQYSLVNKLGLGMFKVGKFLSNRALDSIRTASRLSHESISQRSTDVQERFNATYREFLLKELERLDQKDEELL